MERNRWLQALIILLVAIAGIYLAGMLWQLGVRFGDIILPFFLAWLLAFTLNPLADVFVRSGRIHRPGAIAIVYVFLLLTLALIGLVLSPPLFNQTVQLSGAIPGIVSSLPDLFDGLQRLLDDHGINIRLAALFTEASLVQRAETLGTALAQNAISIFQGIATSLFNTVIILVLSFYFMLDGDRFSRLFVEILPEKWKTDANYLLEAIDRTFGGYMRGLLVQTVVYGLGTGVVMGVAGLPYVLVVSVFAGLIMVIPFIGGVAAMVPPLLLAAFTGDWLKVILVFVSLMLLQQLVLNILIPKVMSESVGMHPLLIFLAVLIGAKEAGIWGAIFGVPIVGVIWSMSVLLFRERQTRRRRLSVVSEDPPLVVSRAKGG